jgi:hypothetical protein
MGKLDCPEESRPKDAAIVVVNLRARTGLEQVDSPRFQCEAAPDGSRSCGSDPRILE